jgi:7,8-dihydro-6-hydroxymethylpterin-pyrophosphokinase
VNRLFERERETGIDQDKEPQSTKKVVAVKGTLWSRDICMHSTALERVLGRAAQTRKKKRQQQLVA